MRIRWRSNETARRLYFAPGRVINGGRDVVISYQPETMDRGWSATIAAIDGGGCVCGLPRPWAGWIS